MVFYNSSNLPKNAQLYQNVRRKVVSAGFCRVCSFLDSLPCLGSSVVVSKVSVFCSYLYLQLSGEVYIVDKLYVRFKQLFAYLRNAGIKTVHFHHFNLITKNPNGPEL